MKEEYLTLKQNLCSARIFLNLFGLFLEYKDEINEFTKIKILNADNSETGMLYFENGVIKIQSVTSLGNLNANYDMSKFCGFQDLECGGAYVGWHHVIKFEINGNLNFNGDMQIGVDMDTHFGCNCTVHSKIKYVDENKNKVELKFMADGDPFSYEAIKDDFREVLKISPWSDLDHFMYHSITSGKYDSTHFGFPNRNVKSIWHNGYDDKNHLKTDSYIIENLQTIEYDSKLCELKDNSVESTIQKGLLMQQIDADFSKKIIELINLFKKDNVSFFSNLINVAFNNVSEEEIKALFGTDIKRINYYNGADNLLDAYFGIEKNKQFSPKDVCKRMLK